ncbi:hypothetical protein BCJMU51_5474 [Bacillus cereus]|uniref:DUF4365 domain-containing protein n=1 Tax=Bacillus cereus TaxID=1396 RepID=UPI001F2F24F6|nr:DUF4365 domain-containing protein [Bacillus cereus]BCB40556.1 hypothetical protein BCM0045_5451 [Bacillus cereus]BCC03392.1 hypothetical protein BCM0057_5474 [Bacillus cereus]BCC26911.1 hypothetical protein BCM0079_5504 [Bacillus cereus]BCC38471.1 hypothetical protein BCM0105_5461 [Bacillus cereus]BCC44269.1 hypothetical protein BCJMU01_5436 [Bacillus cereus]
MALPRFDGNKGSKGVNLVERTIMEELGWIFREQPTQDYGIDGHMEVVDEDFVTGRLIAIQIKAGNSYLKEETNSGFVYRGKIEHYNYWTNHSLPVVLILCDLENDICYWEQISEDTVEIISDSSWKVVVPKTQIINQKFLHKLKQIAENTTEYERRLNTLLLSRTWMEELLNGNRVILESDEWVNKTSGRGSLILKVIDSDTELEKIVLNWPMVFFPYESYNDVFPELFPWANFSVDEDYYEEYEEAEFLEDNAVWDKEEGEYMIFGDFQEWSKHRPNIRPYTIHSGEVASYRLCLNLNELGSSFLLLDNYLRNGIKREKPKKRDIDFF